MSTNPNPVKIFVCPALMDWLIFLVHFAVLYGAGARGMSMLQCAWLGGIFQMTYMAVSLAVGLILCRRNARALLLAATVLSTAAGAVCLVLTGFAPLLVAMGSFGVFIAVFFNAFQTFMRGEAPPGNLARTVAFYTLAWSGGSACGFLASGSGYALGVDKLVGLTMLVGVMVMGALLTYAPRDLTAPSTEEFVEQGGPDDRPVDPVYVLVGWLVIFSTMFAQRPLLNYFPALCARASVSAWAAGAPLFLHMFIQGLAGFAMVRFRWLLYRRLPLWVFQGGGALVLLVMWTWPVYPVCAVGLCLLGVWCGFSYFAAVYYASNSGRRSFNIGINECLVGVGSFSGLFAAEGWMRFSGEDRGMYLVCALALVVSLLAQHVMASLRRQRQPDR